LVSERPRCNPIYAALANSTCTCFSKSNAFSQGGALLHALVIRDAVAVLREIRAELDGAAPSPEEMQIGGAPLVKQIFRQAEGQ